MQVVCVSVCVCVQVGLNVLMGQEPDLAQQIQRLAMQMCVSVCWLCVCMCTGGVECSHGSGARAGLTDTEAGTGCWQCRCVSVCWLCVWS